MTLALLLGILLAMPAQTPAPQAVGVLFLLSATLLVSLRLRIGLLALIALYAAGLWLRDAYFAEGWSDVLVVTQSAIGRWLDGLSPYGVGYPQSTPPGAPYPYGPLALLWYLPARSDPLRMEYAVSLAVLLVLLLRGRPLGLAVFALTPVFVMTASDSSNDTSAGVLLLLFALLVRRWPTWSGVALAAAVAFKPYAAAWLPPLAVWGGFGAAAAFVGGSLALWGPAVLAWGYAPIATSIILAQAIHEQAYYSLAYYIEWLTDRPPVAAAFDRFRLAAGALTTLATLPLVRSGRGVLLAGSAIYLVTLFTGFWSTHSYFAALGPFLCWHLDDWMGFRHARVRLPGDPVGRLTVWVDRRWPVRGESGEATIPVTRRLGRRRPRRIPLRPRPVGVARTSAR